MVLCGIKVSKTSSLKLGRQLERKLKPFLVVFRLVVFRPFTSEVIIAKVKSSDEDGVRRALFS